MIPTKTSNRLNTGRDLPPTSELIAMVEVKRLTKPDSKYTDFKNHRLQQYEETGLTPEEIKSLYHDAGLSLAIRIRDLEAENKALRARLDVTEAVAKAAYPYVVSEVRGTWDDRRVLYQELKDAVVAYEEVAGK